ncbi:MAG: hypothetical protein B7Y99_02545 [Caulobacterales bacterium 32-69-10]|nr:MAG: hypothetical protein B7Y99_02545 [Caulobacterales bacterium 32-69-10]
MPWKDSELTEEQLKLRLSWFFDRSFKAVGMSRVSRVTGISRSTLARYATWEITADNDERDDARIREGKRPVAKAQPDGPQKFAEIYKITRALGVELDHLMVAISRSTDPDSFDMIMRSNLVAEFSFTTALNGERVDHPVVTPLQAPVGRARPALSVVG